MRTVVSAKRCPECGKAALLQALSCSVCGHRFRTRFVEPPVEKTEVFTLIVAPAVVVCPPRWHGAARTFRRAVLGSFLLVALAGGLFCLAWSGRRSVEVSSVPPAAFAPRHVSVSPAIRLYWAITPMMSLYDLDKAAGSMGRVIRASDPHLLLLSYDYPHQSVQVSLSRADPAGRDYQVQAVALYQGKALQRHAGSQ